MFMGDTRQQHNKLRFGIDIVPLQKNIDIVSENDLSLLFGRLFEIISFQVFIKGQGKHHLDTDGLMALNVAQSDLVWIMLRSPHIKRHTTTISVLGKVQRRLNKVQRWLRKVQRRLRMVQHWLRKVQRRLHKVQRRAERFISETHQNNTQWERHHLWQQQQ